MNNKLVIGLCVVIAVIAGLIGYRLGDNGNLVGAAITPYNCLNQQILCNELNAIASSTAGIVQATATVNLTNIGPNTTATSSITGTITLTGAVVGDGCVVGNNTTSTLNLASGCSIVAANTANYWYTNTTSTFQTFATSSVTVTDLPKATFVAPTGL